MDLVLFLIAAGIGLGMTMDPSGEAPTQTQQQLNEIEPTEQDDSTAAADTVVAAPEQAAPSMFEAEDQTPLGKFTTATEVKQILEMTKPQWIAVRNWEGRDLLYFTNLLAWRCATLEIKYSVNGGVSQVLTMEPCYIDEGAPNALKMDGDILPYVKFPENSIGTIDVHVLYDDLSESSETYSRASVQIN